MSKATLEKAISTLQAIIIIVVIVVAAAGGGYWYYTSTLPPPGPKEVKIGAVYPLTGPVTRRVNRDAIDFWIKYLINDAGGIKSLQGAKVRVVWGDCQNKPDLALQETERLITMENVVCVLGSWYSSLTYPTQEVCARLKVPNLNWDSSSPTLLERGYEWYFMNFPHDDWYAKREVDFLVDLLNKKGLMNKVNTIAMFVESALFGQTARTSWLKYIDEAKKAGKVNWKLVEDITFAAPVVDVTPEILKLKAADADMLFGCPMSPADWVKVVKSMTEQNYFPPIWITMGAGQTMFDFWNIEDMRKGVKYQFTRFAAGAVMDQVLKTPKLKGLYEVWMKNFDYFDWGALVTYTSMLTLKYALEDAGKTDPTYSKNFPTVLRDALRKVKISKEEAGVYAVKFNEKTGFNELVEVTIAQCLDDPNKPGDVEWQTIWPWDMASRDPVVPDPRSRGLK
jgi:branched-chain amino acid transport system substrate-binding protein